MKYDQKSFSVSSAGSKDYAENWERIFKKKEKCESCDGTGGCDGDCGDCNGTGFKKSES